MYSLICDYNALFESHYNFKYIQILSVVGLVGDIHKIITP